MAFVYGRGASVCAPAWGLVSAFCDRDDLPVAPVKVRPGLLAACDLPCTLPGVRLALVGRLRSLGALYLDPPAAGSAHDMDISLGHFPWARTRRRATGNLDGRPSGRHARRLERSEQADEQVHQDRQPQRECDRPQEAAG